MADGKLKKKNLTYKYIFDLETGENIEHEIEIDTKDVLSKYDNSAELPEWAKLEHEQCEDCQYKGGKYCPVAIRFAGPIEKFHHLKSHSEATVTVVANERAYCKQTNVQDGLRSMFGLLMATSDCPSMKPFKPMALHHLPFSSLDETIYRVISMYLLECFINSKDKNFIPVALEELEDLYDTMRAINLAMTRRIAEYVENDSTLNAVVGLDALRYMVPLKFEEALDSLKNMFD